MFSANDKNIKLSKKRSCDDCKAFQESKGRARCELNFDIEVGKYEPSEPCYKPRTNMQFAYAQKLKQGT